MIQIYINESSYFVKNSISILEACKLAGINIKRFCYHETLSVSGNCRMCLVEIENNRKVQASCVTVVSQDMEIYTDTPYVKKLRENVLESLLINHPLDCPICDQGGECDLQDQAKASGKLHSKFYFSKRGVENKNIGPLIKTVMTRCIQCTRCVRYTSEICGNDHLLGTLGRGVSTEIGLYVNKFIDSEISGNVIDLCPVGALTAKPYAFKYRPWELSSEESIDLLDGLGSTINFNMKQTEIVRVLPKVNSDINDSFISDKVRFFFDSISNNRLKKVFSKKSDINTDFNNFKKKIYIVVDETCSIDNLVFLKKLAFIDSRINIVKNTSTLYKNVYIEKQNSLKLFLTNLTNTCLIISSNLRIENAIVNAKVRMKYNNENINFLAVGFKFKPNFPVNFISLNIGEICKMIEGKHSSLSTIFLKNKLSIILGKYSEMRFSNTLESLLRNINGNANILTLELYNNSVGSNLMNVQSLNARYLKDNIVVCLSLDDSLNIRKIYNKMVLPNFSVWLNSYGSDIAKKSDVLVPVECIYESGGIFINMEGRAQKVRYSSGKSSLMKSFFNSIFVKNEFISQERNKYIDHIIEMSVFNKNIAGGIFSGSLINSFLNCKVSLKNGLFKSSLEDFYCSDLISRNSKTLATCSQQARSLSNNFC